MEQRITIITLGVNDLAASGYSSYVADPDGNLWEIAFNPFLAQ